MATVLATISLLLLWLPSQQATNTETSGIRTDAVAELQQRNRRYALQTADGPGRRDLTADASLPSLTDVLTYKYGFLLPTQAARASANKFEPPPPPPSPPLVKPTLGAQTSNVSSSQLSQRPPTPPPPDPHSNDLPVLTPAHHAQYLSFLLDTPYHLARLGMTTKGSDLVDPEAAVIIQECLSRMALLVGAPASKFSFINAKPVAHEGGSGGEAEAQQENVEGTQPPPDATGGWQQADSDARGTPTELGAAVLARVAHAVDWSAATGTAGAAAAGSDAVSAPRGQADRALLGVAAGRRVTGAAKGAASLLQSTARAAWKRLASAAPFWPSGRPAALPKAPLAEAANRNGVHLYGDHQHTVQRRQRVLLEQQPSSVGVQQAGQQQQMESLSDWLERMRVRVAALPRGSHTYPLLRRYVTATVLLHWQLAGGSLGPEEDLQARRLLLQVYTLHRSGAAAKGHVEYFHISKSGGTSMCKAARRAGCTTQSYAGFTCLIMPFDDRTRWTNPHQHIRRFGLTNASVPEYARWGLRRRRNKVHTCRDRHSLLDNSTWTFYANEFATHHGESSVGSWRNIHPCRQFLNVMLLREPRARLVSHMFYIMKLYTAWTRTTNNTHFLGKDAAYWRLFAPASTDNYSVRTLLGEEGFHTPVGKLKAETHLPAAMLYLAVHSDVLLILEQGQAACMGTFKWGMGWPVHLKQEHGRHRDSYRATVPVHEWLPADLEDLHATNHLDDALWRWGSWLVRLDEALWSVAEASGASPLPGWSQLADLKGHAREGVACGFVGHPELAKGSPGESAIPGVDT